MSDNKATSLAVWAPPRLPFRDTVTRVLLVCCFYAFFSCLQSSLSGQLFHLFQSHYSILSLPLFFPSCSKIQLMYKPSLAIFTYVFQHLVHSPCSVAITIIWFPNTSTLKGNNPLSAHSPFFPAFQPLAATM